MVSIHHRVRGATVDLLCRSRQADKQAGRVRMSDQFVSAFGMVASGLRLSPHWLTICWRGDTDRIRPLR